MNRMVLLGRATVSALVLLCTIEAIYWPLLMKPGTVLGWWQSKALADVGVLVGLPVTVLAKWFGGRVLLGAALVWSAVVFWLSSLLVARSRKNSVSLDP